jgi:hypothetical protein
LVFYSLLSAVSVAFLVLNFSALFAIPPHPGHRKIHYSNTRIALRWHPALICSDSTSVIISGNTHSRYSDSLRAGLSGDRIPVGASFSVPVQTYLGPHPPHSFPGVKRPERGVNHPHSSRAEVKERVELFIYSTSGPSWPVTG